MTTPTLTEKLYDWANTEGRLVLAKNCIPVIGFMTQAEMSIKARAQEINEHNFTDLITDIINDYNRSRQMF